MKWISDSVFRFTWILYNTQCSWLSPLSFFLPLSLYLTCAHSRARPLHAQAAHITSHIIHRIQRIGTYYIGPFYSVSVSVSMFGCVCCMLRFGYMAMATAMDMTLAIASVPLCCCCYGCNMWECMHIKYVLETSENIRDEKKKHTKQQQYRKNTVWNWLAHTTDTHTQPTERSNRTNRNRNV